MRVVASVCIVLRREVSLGFVFAPIFLRIKKMEPYPANVLPSLVKERDDEYI